MTPVILAYLAALWLARRGDAAPIANALFANWAANQLAVMLYGTNGLYLLGFVLIDFLTGVWLAAHLQGKVARRTALFFLPMMALNAGAFAAGGNPPRWQEITLDALAWAQILWVVLGVWGHGVLAFFHNTAGGIRYSVSRTVGLFRGEK